MGQFPAQVDGVFYRGVVAQAAGWGEQVGGVAPQKHAAFLKALRHQRMPSRPSGHRQDLDGHVVPRSLAVGLAVGLVEPIFGVCFGQGLGGFVVFHLDVKGHFALTIHRHDEGAQLRVDHHIHPSPIVGVVFVKVGRAQVHRQHAPTHKVAFEAGGAFPADTQLSAHHTARAICAHHIGRPHLHGLFFCAADGLHSGFNAVACVLERLQLPAVTQVNAGPTLCVFTQHHFHKFLRHTVRQLGCAPRARHVLDGFGRGAGGGQAQTRQLYACKAREIGNVSGMVGRQTLSTYLLCKAVAPVVLHGAGLGGIGLRVEGGAGFAVHNQAANAAAAQLVGQHEAAGPAASDQNFSF